MAITAAGVGSGLDINGIVSQLMALERQPLLDLQSKNRVLDAQLSAYGKLKSALSSFESAMKSLGSTDNFKVFSASISSEDVLTVETDSTAAAGTYSVNVAQLAQRHKVASKEISESATFSGNLVITVNGNSSTIDTTGKTISQIRTEINEASDNPGVTASLVLTAEGYYGLTLTSDDPGNENAISIDESAVTASGTYRDGSTIDAGVSPVFGFVIQNKDENGVTITASELNAEFTIDGYSISTASNNISSVIQGVSLELNQVGETTVTLGRDDDAIENSVNDFVENYNNLLSVINDLYKGDLKSESSLRSITRVVRNVLDTPSQGLSGSFTALVDIGIKSDPKTGEISIDSSVLKKALENDFDSVSELFADSSEGFATRFAEVADQLQANNGLIDIKEQGLRDKIDYNDNRVLSWEARLELKEAALRAKFASLDSLLGSMQTTSAFLANNLG